MTVNFDLGIDRSRLYRKPWIHGFIFQSNGSSISGVQDLWL